MAEPKPTIDKKLLEAQRFIESLVVRFNQDANAELGLIAQQTVVAVDHLRERCTYWDMGEFDFDWEPHEDE